MDLISKANILIDASGHARLADFGLLKILRDTTTATSNPSRESGTHQWMSPERLNPGKFGLEDVRPTKESDIYSFGMIAYEILSGRELFYNRENTPAVTKVLEGERPERPQGTEGKWFTDGIWNLLQRCWEHSPCSRPKAEHALRYLEKVSGRWIPPQTVAFPLAAGWSNGERSRKGEASSPPRAILRHPLEGIANKIGSCPAHHSPVPSRNTPDPQPLGMDVNDSSQLEPGGPRRVSRMNFLANVWF